MAPSRSERIVVLTAFGLSGAAALAYEVLWTRALTVVVGSTTHAVSILLATFMMGLAVGGGLGGRWADRAGNPLAALGGCEAGSGLAGLLSLPGIFRLPGVYLGLYQRFHETPLMFYVGQMLLCASVMLLPTILMGLTFPLAAKALSGDEAHLGRGVGAAYTANTAGALVGTLVTGFFLVPSLGLSRACAIAALLNAVASASLFWISARRRFVACSAGLALLAGGWMVWPPAPAWSLANYYSAFRYPENLPFDEVRRQERRDLALLSDREYAEGNVRAFRDERGYLLLQVAGKIEGTGGEDYDNTVLLAHLPLASHPAPKSVLVVGLGAGVTAQASKALARSVEVVEINPGVIEAVRQFGPKGLLDGIALHLDDARSFLLTCGERYDIITSEPSYPTQSSVGNLFTREYYQLASRRLAPRGIYCQWLPYYALTNDDVTMMLKTFGQVFPEAMLWKVPGSLDLLLLGSRRPFARGPDEIAREVARRYDGRPPAFELAAATNHHFHSQSPQERAQVEALFLSPCRRLLWKSKKEG